MLIPLHDWLIFACAALIMALTPGPNMMYLVSRRLCQGHAAARLSLLGVAAGFVFHLTIAAIGLTMVFLAVPYAYNVLKFAGAAYLLWLAWQAVRPGAATLFTTRQLPPDSPCKLVLMGFLTNVLNPKIAVFYISIFSQFLDPQRGSVFAQSLLLGGTQILISLTVNFIVIESAGVLAAWFDGRPAWLRAQRWVLASVLTGLAAKVALSERR
jgi:threonine/homoserine/homoserine lactone efflux protein